MDVWRELGGPGRGQVAEIDGQDVERLTAQLGALVSTVHHLAAMHLLDMRRQVVQLQNGEQHPTREQEGRALGRLKSAAECYQDFCQAWELVDPEMVEVVEELYAEGMPGRVG